MTPEEINAVAEAVVSKLIDRGLVYATPEGKALQKPSRNAQIEAEIKAKFNLKRQKLSKSLKK